MALRSKPGNPAATPVITAHPVQTTVKYGFGLNTEQEVTDSLLSKCNKTKDILEEWLNKKLTILSFDIMAINLRYNEPGRLSGQITQISHTD